MSASPVLVHPMAKAPLPRYRVLRDKVVSVGNGQMTRITAGTVLSASSYGDEVMRGILLQLGQGGSRPMRPEE